MAHSLCRLPVSKEVFNIISIEPIIESPTLKSFHELSVKLVRIDVIDRSLARFQKFESQFQIHMIEYFAINSIHQQSKQKDETKFKQ